MNQSDRCIAEQHNVIRDAHTVGSCFISKAMSCLRDSVMESQKDHQEELDVKSICVTSSVACTAHDEQTQRRRSMCVYVCVCVCLFPISLTEKLMP